eukprot:TRINITY_DN2813_c0_g1_i6.p1 TRINITY_DN2813_c0_g1~~TRINITY_DN2813_c0_g1_i6.p1  ORF type:complete len:354 (-),score=44.87 TRINITY_DN2813_c0_g1_i6:333-1394(-)
MRLNSRSTYITVLFTLLLSHAYLAKGDVGSPCTEDWECSNEPYTLCSSTSHSVGQLSGCILLPGFKIDPSSQKIYFLERCNQPDNFTLLPYPKGDPGKVGLYSVNLDGSSLQSISNIDESTGTPQYSIADSFLGLSNTDFFIVKIQRDGPILYSVNRADSTLNEISLGNSTPIALDYDFSTGKTFACLNGEVVSYQDMSALSSFSTIYNSTELSDGFICEKVLVQDNNLFILGATQFGAQILQGSKDGLSSLDSILFEGSIFSFDVSSSTVYFSNFTGLYSFSLSDNTTTVLATDGAPYVSTQFYQSKLYYQSRQAIYSVDVTTQQSAANLSSPSYPVLILVCSLVFLFLTRV